MLDFFVTQFQRPCHRFTSSGMWCFPCFPQYFNEIHIYVSLVPTWLSSGLFSWLGHILCHDWWTWREGSEVMLRYTDRISTTSTAHEHRTRPSSDCDICLSSRFPRRKCHGLILEVTFSPLFPTNCIFCESRKTNQTAYFCYYLCFSAWKLTRTHLQCQKLLLFCKNRQMIIVFAPLPLCMLFDHPVRRTAS